MAPIIRSARVYTAELEATRSLPSKQRTIREPEQLGLSSAILDSIADRSADAFRDGAVFGITWISSFGEIESGTLLNIVARWFCAKLNGALRKPLTTMQHEAIGAELAEVATAFGHEGFPLHAEASAKAAALHYAAAARPAFADEQSYRARGLSMSANAGPARLIEMIRWATTGFGYRPYRLLPTAALLVGIAAGIITQGGVPPYLALSLCVNAYFGWLGTSDVQSLGHGYILILYLVSVTAIVINSTIVALLARRWFRI